MTIKLIVTRSHLRNSCVKRKSEKEKEFPIFLFQCLDAQSKWEMTLPHSLTSAHFLESKQQYPVETTSCNFQRSGDCSTWTNHLVLTNTSIKPFFFPIKFFSPSKFLPKLWLHPQFRRIQRFSFRTRLSQCSPTAKPTKILFKANEWEEI